MIHKTLKKILKKNCGPTVKMPLYRYAMLGVDASGRIASVTTLDYSNETLVRFEDPGLGLDAHVFISVSDFLKVKDPLSLIVDLTKLEASGDGFTFRLIAYDAIDFDSFQGFKDLFNAKFEPSEKCCRVGKLELEALKATINLDLSRYNLCTIAAKKGSLVSCDNHRITIVEVETHGLTDKELLIPKHFVDLALLLESEELSLFFTGDDKVRATIYDSEYRSIAIVSQLVDGTYPDVGKYITEAAKKIVVSEALDLGQAKKELIEFLKPLGKLTKEPLRVSSTQGKVYFEIKDRQLGLSRTHEMPLKTSIPSFETGLNSEYLNQAIGCGFTAWAKQSKQDPNLFFSNRIKGGLLIMPTKID